MITLIVFGVTGTTYAEHQPRPDEVDDLLDNNLDDRCNASDNAEDASQGRACHATNDIADGASSK